MKKKNIVLLSALLYSVSAIAQSKVTAGVTRSTDYTRRTSENGNQTSPVQATKHTYTFPGIYPRVERYLHVPTTSLPNRKLIGHWTRCRQK